MKYFFVVIPFIFTISSFAAQNADAFRCEYTIEGTGKQPFRMTGNIIKSDIENEVDATYLTLQPPTTTGIELDARILFTVWNYNPITLHPRGDTAQAVARTELKGDGAEVSYKDVNGAYYHVKCLRR